MRLATCVALVAIGCGGGKSSEAPNKPDEPVDKDEPKRSSITPEKLVPIIHELGAENVVPTALVVSFATPIIERDESGRVTSKSQLKITPEVPGTLTYSGVSELRFTPTQPLEFDTTYTVELKKVETRDGVLEPTSGTKYSFKTPAFKLLGWAPTEVDLAKRQVTMEIQFSGAVLPNIARNAMSFTVDGAPAGGGDPWTTGKPGIQVLAQRTQMYPNLVVVQIGDARIKAGAKLGLSLDKELASLAGAKTSPKKLDYTISKDPVVALKGARFVEGANGYYLEVACDDDAAPAGHRSYYEGGESSYNMSERCVLADEALAHVQFNPAVKKTYIASGKQGFRVFGDFKRGVYQVKIDAGARSVDGGVVSAPFSRSYSVAARKPQLSFASTGRYLPRKAWSNLGIKHLNVEEVNLVVRQVPPENLVFWLGNTASDAADERTSNVILKKTLPLRADADAQTTTWQDVSTLLPATTKGVLELKLAGVGVNATSRLLLTDLSLVAKKTQVPEKPWLQTVTVWALDMQSSALLDGVDVTLVRKSGKVVAKCTTGGASGCKLEVKADGKDPDQAEPFALIAKKGDDLTYLRYQDLRADVAESSTSGTPYVAPTPYRAAMYSDRGVYRPGDKAHVVAIIRDAKDRAPDQSLPVDVKIIDPRAKVVRKLTMKTNAGGMLAIDHELPAFADTGHWRVQLAVADKPLSAYDLQVEEFVPERMAVTIAPRTEEALVGSKLEFDVAARYLFGGTAIDSGVELNCSIAPERFSPDENSDLTYGVEPKDKSVNLPQVKTQLDPKGQAVVACGDSESATAFTQTAQVTAIASVLEAGSGRATVKTAHATLHPEKFYIGVKTKTPMATTGKTFTVEGMIVDWNGKAYTGQVPSLDIELAHLEADYGYGYDEDTGEARYDRNMRTVPEGRQKVPVIGGKFRFDVTPGEADIGYVVKLAAGKARTELVMDGIYPYEYYSEYFENDRVDQTPRPAKPTKLSVKLPKEIKVGEPTTVKVLAPYRGKLLWTVETDKLVKSEWMDAAGGDASWTFNLADFAPNVYVSAFLVKDPHLESRDAFLPDRAFGVTSVRVQPTHATHVVKISAPKDIRSSSALTVTLDVGPTLEPTFATVAVVDEGILSLTSFPTPDPNAQLFAKRALGVETYETIGWTMLHQPAGASSKTGGGDDGPAAEEAQAGGDKSRVQPVKPVALWSGVVAVGPDGKATVPFQLPTYRGKVRVMAVTASAGKVGRAEAEVTVKDPLVVQVTFPRFVTFNDEIQIPVFMTNLSGGKANITVKLDSVTLDMPGVVAKPNAGPPLVFTGKDTGTLTLDNGRNDTLVFQAKAAMPIGGAKLRVVASVAGGGTYKDEVEVPFLPAGPKERTIQKIKVEAGKLDLAAKATAIKGWMPTSETTTFWLTSNPYGESFDHLNYLIHYPYGCIEQTTSSTRPLLYVAALAEQVDPKLASLRIEDMVLSGVNRVFSMQTPAGGFGYWPGSTEPEDWATAYATHMLLDAKKVGYAVPDERLKEVLAWIDTRAAAYERGLGKYDRHAWQYYDGQVQAYFHYVLALAGKGKKARILKLISDYPANAKAEQAEDLYLLKAALWLTGDRRYEKDLKTVDASPILTERANYWSFYSDRRRRGMQLSTFFDLFGNDPAGEPLAQRVAQALVGQPSYYYNTQELVWGITGLGKWVSKQAASGVAAGTLVADGATINARTTKAKSNDKTWTLRNAGAYKSLTIDIPQSAAGMWLVINSEGVRPGATYKTGGNGMAVSRWYRSLDGGIVEPDKGELKLGDLLYVEVEVTNKTGVSIQNVALVDRLPAGFEIENPRLGRSVKLDWVTDADLWPVDFQNMRDDRIEAFGTLPPNSTKKIIYTVRAVTSGKFAIPPVEAEAMYDPTLWARDDAGTAIIGGPWTGKTI